MDKEALLVYLKSKPDAGQLAGEAGADPALLDALFALADRERSPIRYTCTKAIRMVSEQQPAAVYPHFGQVAAWLRDANSFVKWDGILTLANLAAADSNGLFADIYEEYFALLRDARMVTAANVAANAWKIVQARPQWEPDITGRLLEVPGILYLHRGEPSPECSRVICGHVLDCFDHYFDLSCRQQEMLCFSGALLDCPRKKVAKSAAGFLKRHGKADRAPGTP